MSEAIAVASGEVRSEWALRPWLTALLLGCAGLAIHALTGNRVDVAWRAAAAAFVLFGALVAAFTVERERWREPVVFAVLAGAVMAGLAWQAVAGGGRYADPGYGFAAGVIATALALPLFQAGFHRRRFAVPYPEFHELVWTDAISAGGSLAFAGLSWVVLAIVAELFDLLQIHLVKDLMEQGAFDWTFSGLAFGAALGTIRNELRLLGTLRTIVALVLSLLAVPVAAALALFLAAMLVSGPQVLWQATRSATPVLLACAAGAFVLANTILRADDTEMPVNRALRLAALVLALTILPLTAFAAVSMGTRVAQHGLSPERIWGMVAIAVACAYAVAYAVGVLGGLRQGVWRRRVRGTNLALAAGVCAVALFLALPIFDFGVISASSQVARLQSGKVTPEQFDFAALRWDMGEGGRRALARLATSGDAKVAELARSALAQTSRPVPGIAVDEPKTRAEFKLRVQPEEPALRKLVLDYLVANRDSCPNACVALDLGLRQGGARRVALVSGATYQEIMLPPDKALNEPADEAATPTVTDTSRVEIRSWTGRRVFVDGQPVGPPLD